MYFVWFARPALIIQRRLFYGTSFIATCVHDSPQLCWGFGIVSIKYRYLSHPLSANICCILASAFGIISLSSTKENPMLQKIERFVLKKLSKLPKKANYEAKDFYPYSGDEILCAMESLESKGYLKSVTANLDFSSLHCEITTQGRFYREYRIQCFISDIFVPAIVAVITSLITYFLCGYPIKCLHKSTVITDAIMLIMTDVGFNSFTLSPPSTPKIFNRLVSCLSLLI